MKQGIWEMLQESMKVKDLNFSSSLQKEHSFANRALRFLIPKVYQRKVYYLSQKLVVICHTTLRTCTGHS